MAEKVKIIIWVGELNFHLFFFLFFFKIGDETYFPISHFLLFLLQAGIFYFFIQIDVSNSGDVLTLLGIIGIFQAF